ncbi:beta-lactamase domain-containing protein [Thermaerobacter marianensis DSM 12885]|uniref:Beta-lactamase domain-containing protein n=1 Tax=Thermaerobacter marianensis (strain ATCC 700841 / DSM 12885 / JCM 10246 / 7p75a) TaxID=644966 RepID=E6SG58_THEM7|nr:MBL fold metallo-hydrolase [Thermaerobacter marianensis]ADU50475.1 beta-lactamase domain-containing protein [Thermaerobacter marianensis DSM 12885]
MRLTILGRDGPYPAPGGACSGYLLEGPQGPVLLDCGPGVLARLRQRVDVPQLAAVFYSHYHPDHCSDHFVLRYVLDIARYLGCQRPEPLPLYGPARPADLAGRMPYKDVFTPHFLDPGESVAIAGFDVEVRATDHPIPCLASSWSAGGRRVVYSGDTGPGAAAELVQLARGADLLLIEASLLARRGDRAPGHLTARQAAEIAREAGVRQLLLTHLLPEYDPQEVLAEAQEVFPAARLAEPGATVELP